MNVVRLAVITVLLAPSLVSAKCAYHWGQSWSDDQPISPNDWVVVEGGGDTAKAILDLANRSPRLVAKGHSVPVRVMATHTGQMNRAQAVLALSEALRPEHTYRLEMTRAPSGLSRLQWSVQNVARSAVAITGGPKITDKKRTRFGCGPAVYVHVEVPTTGTTLGFLVEVADARGRSHRYLVRSADGRLSLGHGMCSGAFELTKGQTYRVHVLSALTRTGHAIPVAQGRFEVKAP